ncbi:MAG TPA: hypothetical protein V6C84_23555 [Coleofasciculaceae cyanobacterium]|jgi:hypothetical protein
MLKTAKVASTPATDRLIKRWTVRYSPDLSLLPERKGDFPTAELVETASQEGRTQTGAKVRQLLQLNGGVGLETHTLFSYIPNVINSPDARQIAEAVGRVYEKMLDIYQSQEPPSYYLRFMETSSLLFSKLALPTLQLPVIQQLAEEINPMLLQLQDQHVSSADLRTIGFITTNFHFSTQILMEHLTLCEQVLLNPYLKFVEEQVCIPWQRLCASAASHLLNSPDLVLVESLLEVSYAVAQAVYDRGLQQYPHHRSRRGGLHERSIRTSTLRDLNMFQGYLCLCILEGNMNAIDQELLPLCVAVFPSLEVKWELVEDMLQWLEMELLAQVSPEQRDRLRPYTQGLKKAFALVSMRSLPVNAQPTVPSL